MRRSLSVMLSVGLLISLGVLGCGGGGSIPPGEEGNGPSLEKSAAIPPPGTVRIQRPVEWASLFPGASRAMESGLGYGYYTGVGGAPTAGTVPEERLNMYSAASSANPMVWTMTPTFNADGNLGDNDLGIYANGFGAFAVSSNVDNWEEWAAFDAFGPVRYFGMIWGAPDGVGTHSFNVEADRSAAIVVNGATLTGLENVPGSDWFHFLPLWNGASWDPVTVNVTALGGDDPDLYLYDTALGNGSAPVVWSTAIGSDWVSYTSTTGYRLYARVKAFSGAPCDYTIEVNSP